MGKLSQKMTRDMAIRGLKKNTQVLYLLAIRTLYEFYQTSPELLSDDDVQRFIFSLIERDLAWGTINAYVAGLRFFYGKTLKQDLERFVIPCPKKRKKLPQILSCEEVRRVMGIIYNPQKDAFFKILYDTGVRGGEAVHLRVADIDRSNKRLWVRNGKGGTDRGVYLSPEVLEALTRYWRAFHFDGWIFPGPRNRNQPMSRDRALRWFHALKKEAGITKEGGLHMWRHTYATHRLETGHDLYSIKKALGHRSIVSTMIYLQLAHRPEDENSSLLNGLYDENR